MRGTRLDVANLIERFCAGETTAWEWDDFVGVRNKDSELEQVRTECLKVRELYPAGALGSWCSAEGLRRMLEIAARLKSGVSTGE